MMDYDIGDWYWRVGGDETQVYSSNRGGLIPVDDAAFLAWCENGNTPTNIANMSELIAVLRAANVPPYHKVKTATVVSRLLAADSTGKLFSAAHQAILSDPVLFWRFNCAREGAINGDDPGACAFLAAFGADPSVILAPE